MRLFALILLALITSIPARAQIADGFAANGERIEIGLSTDTIAITSDFAGVTLTIFGAIDNADPRVQRQGRYDVFVVLEGPNANLVTRRKDRVVGIWMNTESQSFVSVPESYLVASTRPSRDVTDPDTRARLGLGVDQISLVPTETLSQGDKGVREFSEALRRLKQQRALYAEFSSGVRFISRSLFRAQMWLPANVPLGQHTARAYLFSNGHLVALTEADLQIRKAGLEFRLFNAAQNQALIYGMASVVLAFMVGWLGRVMFRRD